MEIPTMWKGNYSIMVLFQRRYLVEINFKSGNSIKLWFKNLSCKYNGDELISLKWTTLDSNQILFLSLKEIESVRVIKVRGRMFKEKG